MVNEAYVSFETAKLLKEKGFDVPVPKCYSETFDNKEYEKHSFEIADWNHRKSSVYNDYPFVSRPTHQMALAWLREKHKVCITIYPDKENGYEAVLYNIKDDVEIILQSFGIYGSHIFEDSYEKAVEAALKYSLENLI